jgi:hypothetical protein
MSAHYDRGPGRAGRVKWATCAARGTQFQRVQLPPRQGSSRPGSPASRLESASESFVGGWARGTIPKEVLHG